MAVAVGMLNALRTNQPMATAVPDPGRANVISCTELSAGRERLLRLGGRSARSRARGGGTEFTGGDGR